MLPGKAKTSVYNDAQGCSSAARGPHSGRKYFLQSLQSSRRRQGSHLDALLSSISSPISVPAPRVCVLHSAAWHTPFRASSRDLLGKERRCPLQVRRAAAEAFPNRRQSDIDDRPIDEGEARRQDARRQHQPRMRAARAAAFAGVRDAGIAGGVRGQG